MKKLTALLLALVLVMGLAACGKNSTTDGTKPSESVPVITDPDILLDEEINDIPSIPDPNPATEVLNDIWNAVSTDEPISVMGGDVDNMVIGAPGNYSLTNEGLTAQLLVPADQVANLTCASSMIHGMLANNLTCGLFEIAEGTEPETFAHTMKEAVDNNQWMCGMPETVFISIVEDNYVLVCFGLNVNVVAIQAAVQTIFEEAEIIYNEPIVG